MTEVTSHSIQCNPNSYHIEHQNIKIFLEGYQKCDTYATNLELTGYTNWYGSQNMCNMIADHSYELFNSYRDDIENLQSNKNLNFIELGSGLGKGGIMSMKILEHEGCYQSKCVLSDGEDEIITLLQSNCKRNLENGRIHYKCMKLYWGETVVLDELLFENPLGFDIIIGSDLIYGSNGYINLGKLLYSVSILLSKRSIKNNMNIIESTDFDKLHDQYNIRDYPTFYLAITRREFISLESFEKECNKFGLTCACILEDYTFDIFDNQVDSSSLLWRDTIIKIIRN